MRVLYVEDSAMSARLMQRIFTQVRQELYIAISGWDGFRMALSLLPDLIFMDVCLPDMSGLDVVRGLREQGLDVPIIALTACAFSRDRELCLEAGCDAYISKPYHVDTIFSLVQNYQALLEAGALPTRDGTALQRLGLKLLDSIDRDPSQAQSNSRAS